MGEELPDPAGDGGTLTAVGPGFSPASAGAQGGLDNPLGFDDELTEEDELVRQLACADSCVDMPLQAPQEMFCPKQAGLFRGSSEEVLTCSSSDEVELLRAANSHLHVEQHYPSCCQKHLELVAENKENPGDVPISAVCVAQAVCLQRAELAGAEDDCIPLFHNECCLSCTGSLPAAHKAGCSPAEANSMMAPTILESLPHA